MKLHDPAELDAITEEDFEAYEGVRKSGVCNMYDSTVERVAGITPATKLGIMTHYGELCKKWPHIRNLEK